MEWRFEPRMEWRFEPRMEWRLEPRMDTNAGGGVLNHEWTRMDTNERGGWPRMAVGQEPFLATDEHGFSRIHCFQCNSSFSPRSLPARHLAPLAPGRGEGSGVRGEGTLGCRRLEPRMDTNAGGGGLNHEWTRMDTNAGGGWPRMGIGRERFFSHG